MVFMGFRRLRVIAQQIVGLCGNGVYVCGRVCLRDYTRCTMKV